MIEEQQSSVTLPCYREVRLVAFDVDGTLVENEEGLVVWQVFNRLFIGDSELNVSRLKDFLDGRLSYADWVRLDMEGWQDGGATRTAMEAAIRSQLRLVPHARRVVHELVARGYKLAVVSGTLDLVLDVLFPDHPFERVFTNLMRFDESGAICGWTATPYDMEGKAEALRVMSKDLGIPVQSIAFVGDHLNDCAAMRLSGCAIAYDPKNEDVRKLARHVIAKGRLDTLLELFPSRHALS